MSLLIQIRSIVYFFLMGTIYSFVLAYILCIIQSIKWIWLRNLIEMMTHVSFTIVLYYGLIYVNQGIIHIYFIVSLILGFFSGYMIYQPIILPYAMRVRYQIHKLHKRIKEAKARRKAKKLAKQQEQSNEKND